MLWHISPRLLSPFKNVAIVDVEIRPLGLHLVGGVNLATRRPYRNNRYAVACRKQGQKAIDGLLLETTPLDDLHITARWTIADAIIVTHHVHYQLLDHDFEAASDDIVLWYACSAEFGGWSNRCPAWLNPTCLGYVSPVMEVDPHNLYQRMKTEDILDEQSGMIISRRQTFAMPTIERDRLLSTKINSRLPPLSAVFR